MEFTKEQEKDSRKNRKLAWMYFYPEGKGHPKKGYCLHHINQDWRHNNIERYIQWNIEDLIMMTNGEHSRLHNKGNQCSEEAKQKMSKANTGKNNPMYGKNAYANKTEEEMKIIGEKISKALKGKHRSEETIQKISKANTGKNNPMYGKHHYYSIIDGTRHFEFPCCYEVLTKQYVTLIEYRDMKKENKQYA